MTDRQTDMKNYLIGYVWQTDRHVSYFNANLYYSKNNSKSFSPSFNKCKESQCISNRLNNIKSIINIPILKESLEFRFKFISELHEHLSNDKHKFNLNFLKF